MYQELIGKKVQKVETTRRGIVSAVKDGSHFLKGMMIVEFTDGYKGLYSHNDLRSMCKDGTHFHNCDN